MKLTKEGFEGMVEMLKMIEEELTYITVWVNMGASISKQDRDNETEYFDKAYSLFLSRCESISHYCDNVKYHLDCMRKDPEDDQ